jgi:hypothetical protein
MFLGYFLVDFKCENLMMRLNKNNKKLRCCHHSKWLNFFKKCGSLFLRQPGVLP